MVKIIEYSSDLYPERLREIQKPPSRLYVEGNVKILNEFGLAVIGSRTNTQYGDNMCKRFVKSLVEYNINIISGHHVPANQRVLAAKVRRRVQLHGQNDRTGYFVNGS